MLIKNIIPRFNDTDALGHINNASIVTWFEDARRPIFEIFIPDLDPRKWNLILARVEVDYLKQVQYENGVVIETEFEKLGTSSMTIVQRVVQNAEVVAQGKCIMVHFDYNTNKSQAIPDEIRVILEKHLIDE